MTVEEFFDHVITVRMREDRSSLDIIDQTLLPGTIKRIHLNTPGRQPGQRQTGSVSWGLRGWQ